MDRKDSILIACAEPKNRQYLRYVLSERFHLLEASGARQMLALLEQNMGIFATVVIGTSVLDQGGLELMQEEQSVKLFNEVPVVILNEKDDPSLVNAMFQRGAADVIDLHYDALATLRRIDTVARLYMHRNHADELINERSEILRQSNDTMVDVLSSIIEYRSAESGHHVLRIRNFVRTLLVEVMHRCPEYGLTERTVNIISSASSMHDVGKISIPDAILNKPSTLTDEEWEIMKTHSVIGCQILEALGGMADQEYLRYARNICRYHHERWDGSGYPDGLVGDQIPICAQVVGLADAYEALTAERVYKQGYSFDQAINMILKGECGAFSPKLLACLKNVTEEYERLTNAYADGRVLEENDLDLTLPPPDAKVSSLERIQDMYFALIHYINGFLMEVNLDQGLFHVIYNPYPDMAQLENVSTLSRLVRLVLDTIVVPDERQRMHDLIYVELPRFVEENLRRSTHRFHYRDLEENENGQFEITLLRNSSASSKHRSLAILFRKVDSQEAVPYASAWYSLAESTYVCKNDQYFSLVSLDRKSTGLGGYSKEDLFGTFRGQLIQLIHPDDREMVQKEFTRQLRSGTEVRLEHRVVLKSGKTMWVTNKSRLEVSENGQELLHSFLTDITRTKTEYEDLRSRHDRYIDILTKTENVLFEWDVATDMVEFSDTWEHIFHSQPPRAKVRSWMTQGSEIHPDDIPLLMDKIINLENGSDEETQEVRIATDRGRYLWYRIQGHAIRDDQGNLCQVVGVITSVEKEKKKEQVLQDRAERDSLTKLLNKDAGRKRITNYLSHYPGGTGCAMLIIDLDDFKRVNDTYGHLFGDAVLSKVAQSIKRQFDGQDIVARIGGDEFLVLVRGLTDRRLLEDRCRRLIGSFCVSLKAQHPELTMSCSVGIALSPEHGKSYYELFNHADQALYRAKALGKNTYCFYDAAMIPADNLGHTSVSRRIDSDEEPGLAENGIVRHIFKLLYSADDVRAAIDRVIAHIGKQLNVSRVYIFENSSDNRYCSNTFEWCNEGIESQREALQNLSYETDIPGYAECLTEQDLLYCSDIRQLPQHMYDLLEPQGIKSMLHCAIRNDGVLRGYIGFDDCEHHRMWTREEISMLTYFTEVLSIFLMKSRRQTQIANHARDIMNLMENQDMWMYIIDPDTWNIFYMNKKARNILGHDGIGQPCYQVIHGRTSPCPGCHAQKIREEQTYRWLRDDGAQKILIEAAQVQWEGKEGCMMSSRLLPDM